MTYGTKHIRAMLAQAINACEEADGLMATMNPGTFEGNNEYHLRIERQKEEVHRLLMGAAINASHAWAELNDERFRLRYGDNGY